MIPLTLCELCVVQNDVVQEIVLLSPSLEAMKAGRHCRIQERLVASLKVTQMLDWRDWVFRSRGRM